jgi:hypothetical protein
LKRLGGARRAGPAAGLAPTASRGKQLGQRRRHEHEPEGDRLADGAPRPLHQEGRRCAGAHEPRLRVDPLKRGRAEDPDRPAACGRAGTARRRDLPGEPAEECGPAPLERPQDNGVVEDQAAEPEGTS